MAGIVSSLGVPQSGSAGRYERNPATREAPWVRITLLTLGLAFFGLFLIMPLVAVFHEALRKAGRSTSPPWSRPTRSRRSS